MPMTSEQRIERAKNAVAVRWARYDWAKMPFDDAVAGLAELREEYEKAAHAIQQRMIQPATLHCHTCQSIIPSGKWVQNVVYRDKTDQLIKTIYFCKAICVSKYNKAKQMERVPDAPPIKDDNYLPK